MPKRRLNPVRTADMLVHVKYSRGLHIVQAGNIGTTSATGTTPHTATLAESYSCQAEEKGTITATGTIQSAPWWDYSCTCQNEKQAHGVRNLEVLVMGHELQGERDVADRDHHR